jgi:phage-related protein
MASVISVLAKVSADASNFVGGMQTAQTAAQKLQTSVNQASKTSAKDFDTSTKEMGNSAIKLGGVLATAAKGFLLFQGLNFMKDAVAGASAFEAEFEGVNQAFGTGAALVQEYAKNAASTAGVAEVAALRAAKSFGVFATSAGLAGDDAGKFATGLVQAAGDLGSFYDLPTEQALAAISSGLRGETEPLRRFNILIGEAEMNSKAMAMGLGANSSALTQQQKVLVRQQLIMDGLGVAQGDFVKYQDTYGNSIKTVGALMQNLSKDVGAALLPVLAKLAGALVPIISELGPLLTKVFEAIAPVIQVVVDNLASFMPILDPLVNILAIVADVFADLIEAVLPPLIEILKMIAPYWEQLAELLSVIVKAILPPLVKLLEKVFIPILGFLLEVMEFLLPVITAFAEVLGGVLAVAVDVVTGAFEFLAGILKPVWEAIKPIIAGFMALAGLKPIKLKVTTNNATLPWWANGKKKPTANDFAFEMPTSGGMDGMSGGGGGPSAAEKQLEEANRAAEEAARIEKQILDDRLRAFESFNKSVESLFSQIKDSIVSAFSLPNLGNSVSSITRNFNKLLQKTKDFASNISTLSGLGLNSTLLQQVISAGPIAGAKLAQALAAGGSSFIKDINTAYGDFGNIASGIASTATTGAFANQSTVNNYSISVTGGLATGSDVGRAVVNAIKDYERQSGAAWRG